MPSNRTNSASTPGWALITLATVAAMAVIAVLLLGVMTAQAQNDKGAVPNLRLSSPSAGQLTIAWDAPEPAPSDYRIVWAKQDLDFPSYKAANEANRGNEYPGGTETSITLTGLTGGETFKASMRARYTSGGLNGGPWSGPWTDTITARVKDDLPAAPTGVTADASHDSVTLSWTAPASGSAVTGYRVLRGTDANSLTAIAQDTGSAGTEYTDSTVAEETTYFYAVLALSQDGDGAQSATISAATPAAPQPVPSAPTSLVATPSHDQVTLSWDDPQNSSITGYQIWRGADAASLASIQADTGSTATTYVDGTVTAETAYHYAVSAINAAGTGDRSGAVSATTLAAPQAQTPDPNSAPTASNGTVTTDEDTDHVFSASEFNYSDSDGDTLASVKITELPAAGQGTLTLDGAAIALADLPKAVTKAELDDGKLIYTPPADANGTAYASFRFKVNDGSADSTDAYTMTISVTAVNDPATGAPTITGDARVGETLTVSTSDIVDPEGLPGNFTYQWKRFSADGTTFEADIGTDSNAHTLTASEQDARVKVEVSFTDNEGSSEGPLVSAAYPSDSTVEAPEEEVSSPGISIVVEAPPWTTAGSAGTVSAEIVGFDVFPDPDGHEYTYRIDVLDRDGGDADVCEGNGMGEALRIFKNKTAWIFVRRGATELREAQISDQCEIGAYTARASVSDDDSALVVSAEAEFEITQQPPAAPTGLTTSGVSHNSVTLSWTDPEDASITGYRVLRGNEAGNLTAIADDTGSDSVEYTDSTVAAETAYHYAVLALSQSVDGAQSTTVSVTTRAAPEPKKGEDKPPTDRVTRAAPGVPLNLTAVSGASQLTFSWDPPASDGGSAIVRYNYRFGPAGGTVADENHGTNPTGPQTLTKTGLTNGTSYSFEVRAVTNFGSTTTVGTYATVNATPGLPKAPARPIVAPVPRTTDSLTVNWTAPENTGRPAITSYDVRHSSDFGETWTDGPQDVSGGPVTLTDLVYGESFGIYLVQVRATNTAGDGPWSESARETLFPPDEEVAADLGLVPAGPRNDDRFRLLFITHATNTAESDQGYLFDDLMQTDFINSLVVHWTFFRQSDAADLASNQRALLSTPGVDARVRTDTTFTAGDKGVPIYWLRGSKVADDYEDFYDGSWDDVASPRNSRGAVVTVTTQPWTGSANDGTELFDGMESRAAGRTQVGIVGLGSTTDGHGPLSSGSAAATGMRPLFGLTHVYVVRDDRFLLSNMAQTGESNDRRSARRSQRFTTGSNPGGYALDSVTVSAAPANESPPVAHENWSVSIYTVDASGHPATEHAALTAPQDYIQGRNIFTAPAGTTLSADTTYAVVVTAGTTHYANENLTFTDLNLEVTTSNSENERSASDWSIFDAFDYESGSSWSADTGSKALYVAVRGAPVPDKPTGLSATPSGSDRINLSWTAPSMDGGSAIIGYKIEVSSDGGTNWADLVADTGSTDTTYSHTGLSVGDTRHYRVSAISINGTGPASDTDMATIASAATGVPAIAPANAFRVPGVLTANKGSIADANGLPLESTFTWQWVQVDGMIETDIVSATSQTYTLAAADAGKKIKVKASFTDTGTPPNAEGPLTSIAYPTTGSILPMATDCLPPTSYPGGATQIWTGRVTIGQVKVGNDPLSIRGYLSQSTNLGIVTILATDAAGTLSNTAFAAGSQYTIKLAGTQIANNTLFFATTPAMTDADRKQLTLYVCDEAFPFSEARSSNEAWFWRNSGLDWRDKVDRTLYISRDQTEPTVSSFDVTGTTLTLTFSEDLGAAASLANSAFEVKKTTSGGTETTVTLSGTPTISGRTVTLTLAATVPANNRITVTYTKPTSGTANKLVDRFGNEVEDFNQVVAEVPGAPTGLSAAPNGTTGIDLSWTAPADNGGRVISGYKIEVSTDGGASWTVLVANTGSTDTTYAHSGLTAGSTRHYRVSAINTIGASAASNTANANTPTTADHRPTSSTSRVTATEDKAFTFSGSNFAFFDNDAGATLVSVKITALLEEGRGTLALDGTTITSSVLPRTVTKAELDAGKLIYTPPNNWNGHATFRFKVNDGSVDSASAYTMLVSVTSVNDLPTSSGKTVTIIKGDTHTFELDDFPFTDVDDSDTLASVKITTLPKAGTLTLRGVALAAADLPKTVTKNDLDRDRLRFVPADNASGTNYASFKFKVNDGTDDSASENTLRMSIDRPATGLPTITGMVHVGATLTADTSGIKDEDGLGRFTYQWISNNGRTDTDITDATNSTYELVEADERKTIKVKVSFTDKIGNKENLTSAATRRVAARPNRLPTGKPTITGAPRVGETLTASISDIADADGLPNTFRYRWKRFTLPGVFDANIGSNSNTYVLSSSELAMQVRVEVSYTDGRGAHETTISDAYPRRNGVEPAPTPSNDCARHSHPHSSGSSVDAPTHWHPCLELIRPVAKIPLNYDGDLTLGVEKTYTHGVTYIPSVQEDDRSNVTGDKAIYRIRLEPGQKYRFTVRRDTIGGDSFGRYDFGIGHLQTTCVDIFGCDHHGGVEPIHLDQRTTNAPLVHPGALTSLTEKGMNYSQFFQEFQTPCLPGSPDTCGPALLNNYDYPNYYYAVVDPASGAAAGERVHLKVERLPSTHVLADSPLDDQYAWQLMGPDKYGKSGHVLNFIGASIGMWDGATVSGYLDHSNDVDMHRTFRTANNLDCKITPAGHASGTPAKAATNLKIKTEDGLPRDSIDSVTLDPFSYVEVYSTTGDTGGYQITASECARNTTYYATPGVVKRNHPTGLVVGTWLTTELAKTSSEAVTVTAEDDFDLIKFGRGPDPSDWTLKPGEEGLVEYNINLHKITLNAGTSYNMKRRGDLRNDLALIIVSANDSCDDQKFISGGGDFIQDYAKDGDDGSEFTPILHYSAQNTRSDTDTDTGTSECYIIAVSSLNTQHPKSGSYSILVTEN